MFLRISIIFAVGCISFASGLVRERRSAYESALKCTKAGGNGDVSALRVDGDRAALLEDACIYLRVTYYTLNLTTFNFVISVLSYQPFFQQLNKNIFVYDFKAFSRVVHCDFERLRFGKEKTRALRLTFFADEDSCFHMATK